MLINLLKSSIDDTWNVIPNDAIRNLDRKYGITYFALKSDRAECDLQESKQLTPFYKECLLYFQEMCRLSRKKDIDIDELIWCNNKFTNNGKPLRFWHWARNGITHVSDLLHNNIFDENRIRNKIQIKAGFMFEIHSIKKVFTKSVLSNNGKKKECYDMLKAILEMTFEVPTIGYKKLYDLTSSDMYKIFTLGSSVELKSTYYWISKFPNENIDFDRWYKLNFTSKLCPRECLDFNWRVFHNLVNVEVRLEKMNYSDGICLLCGQEKENISHLLVYCEMVTDIWEDISVMINEVFNIDLLLNDFHKIVGLLEIGTKNEVINMIISIVRWNIWKRRCDYKYDKTYTKTDSLIQLQTLQPLFIVN